MPGFSGATSLKTYTPNTYSSFFLVVYVIIIDRGLDAPLNTKQKHNAEIYKENQEKTLHTNHDEVLTRRAPKITRKTATNILKSHTYKIPA